MALSRRLVAIGPESGIVNGESPLISLSYIDKTVYKHTNTCVYMVSTESMSHQLSSCLMACYLIPTTCIFIWCSLVGFIYSNLSKSIPWAVLHGLIMVG